jgi:hypothetical protein
MKNLDCSSLKRLILIKCLNNSPPLIYKLITGIIIILYELHKEIDTELILKHIFHVDDKGMIYIEEDVFFQFYILKLFIIDDDIFAYAFHSQQLIREILMLHQEHLAKGPLSNHLPNNKI